jgi:hypothetical protein
MADKKQSNDYIVRIPHQSILKTPSGNQTHNFHMSDVIAGVTVEKDGKVIGILAYGTWPIPIKKLELVNERAAAKKPEPAFHEAAGDGDMNVQLNPPGHTVTNPGPNVTEPAPAIASPSAEPGEKGAEAIKNMQSSQLVKNVVDKSTGTVKGMLWGGVAGLIIGFVLKRPVYGAGIGIALGGYAGYKWLTKAQIDNLMMPKK